MDKELFTSEAIDCAIEQVEALTLCVLCALCGKKDRSSSRPMPSNAHNLAPSQCSVQTFSQ